MKKNEIDTHVVAWEDFLHTLLRKRGRSRNNVYSICINNDDDIVKAT